MVLIFDLIIKQCFKAGESERKLYNLTKFPPNEKNEKNLKNEENLTNAKNIENQQEIEKLKEEIDNLAISLQV